MAPNPALDGALCRVWLISAQSNVLDTDGSLRRRVPGLVGEVITGLVVQTMEGQWDHGLGNRAKSKPNNRRSRVCVGQKWRTGTDIRLL